MTQVSNFTWGQGEDLTIELIYKEGDTVETAVVKDLSAGYELRMDLVVPSTKERVYTFNTSALADVDGVVSGDQADSTIEGALSSGAGGTPNVTITVPRSLSLPGGTVYEQMTATPPVTVFNFDVFLRHTASNRQAKILKGTVTVEESNTLWL